MTPLLYVVAALVLLVTAVLWIGGIAADDMQAAHDAALARQAGDQ